MKVPRWLELQAEIDYLYFEIEQIYKRLPKSPIESAIDDATGYGKERNKEICEICLRLKELKPEWSRETGKISETKMEDEILKLLKADYEQKK